MKAGTVIFAIAVALAALAWATRWQIVETHTGDRPAAIFMVNRWTGEVVYVQGSGRWTIPADESK